MEAFKWEMTKKMLGSIVRYILIAVSTWLVTNNIVPQEIVDAWISEFTAVVVGATILAIPVVWAYLNKRFDILALVKAVQTSPPVDTPKEVKAAIEEVKAEVKAEAPLTTLSA